MYKLTAVPRSAITRVTATPPPPHSTLTGTSAVTVLLAGLLLGALLLLTGPALASSIQATPTQTTSLQASPNAEPAGATANPDKLLTVGYSQWPPFFVADADGSVRGINAELIRSTLEPQGYQIEFVEVSWTRGLHSLATGAVDVITSASYTELRARYAYYSKPYYQEHYALYGPRNQAHRYRDKPLATLLRQGFRLGIHMGTVYDPATMQLLTEHTGRGNISAQTDFMRNYRMLNRGRIDGFLQECSEFFYQHNNQTETDQLVPYLYLEGTNQHVLFSKQSVGPKVVADFNRGLKQIVASGAYQSIFRHWNASSRSLHHLTQND